MWVVIKIYLMIATGIILLFVGSHGFEITEENFNIRT